jgi:hypothetical protein
VAVSRIADPAPPRAMAMVDKQLGHMVEFSSSGV